MGHLHQIRDKKGRFKPIQIVFTEEYGYEFEDEYNKRQYWEQYQLERSESHGLIQ